MFRTVATRGRSDQVVSNWKLESSRTYSSTCGIQQIQGGLPQVATHRRPQPTRPRHLADQGRDRALAVGAGDGDDGGLGGAGKEFDVAHHLQTAPQGDRQALVAHGQCPG